jgi:hypothetical protein
MSDKTFRISKRKLDDLERVGTMMSNMLYNWKQDEKRFRKRERDQMGELVRDWDAAVRREA